ncbi:hypothetical protein FQN51_005506 [Onygenales sp. PD_10]|nr:hypothetical protein FQN51_005506 [Onygenales sp. PD_10]
MAGNSSLFVKGLVWGLVLAYGFFTFFLYGITAICAGTFFRWPTEKERLELLLAKDRLWNLSKQWAGLSHHFLTLKNGFKFHYVSNDFSPRPTAGKPLVIFMHGFPDSWAIWRHLLASSSIWEDSTVVAVDLPGYGGTDSLEKYSATVVLEHLTEFIVEIRKKSGVDDADDRKRAGKVILVGHDWGAVLGFRLAAEAPQLADRFILSNGPLLPLAKSNLSGAISSSGKMFTEFLRNPFHSHHLLLKSLSALKPLFRQLLLSGYIFVFQLPMPMVRFTGSGGNYSFLKAVHRAAAGNVVEFTVRDAEESMASTLGPGPAECKTTTNDSAHDTYSPSVIQRIKRGNFGDTTSYYRHGTATGTWHKSLQAISSLHEIGESQRSSIGLPLQADAEGALKANTTIVWGQLDTALDPRVMLEGIADYLVHGSQVVMLPRTAHFSPMEVEGRRALERAVVWAVQGEKGDVTECIREVYPGAMAMVRK